MNGADRRQQSRHAIELSVEYKRLNTFFADYTKNISKGGTFIRTERPLDIATEFVFALTIRGLAEPLRLRGRVKWIVTPADATPGSPAGMGIEFMYADDAERRATEAIVEKLMADELGDGLAARLLGRRGPDDGPREGSAPKAPPGAITEESVKAASALPPPPGLPSLEGAGEDGKER